MKTSGPRDLPSTALLRLLLFVFLLVSPTRAANKLVQNTDRYATFDISPSFPGANRFVETVKVTNSVTGAVTRHNIHVDLGVQYLVQTDAYVARKMSQWFGRAYTWDDFILGTVGERADVALLALDTNPGGANAPAPKSILMESTDFHDGYDYYEQVEEEEEQMRPPFLSTTTIPPQNLMRGKLQTIQTHQRRLMQSSIDNPVQISTLTVPVGDEPVRQSTQCTTTADAKLLAFCQQYEATNQEAARVISEMTDREYQLTQLIRAAHDQAELAVLYAQADSNLTQLIATFINQTAADQKTVEGLLDVLKQNRNGVSTIFQMVDLQQGALDNLVNASQLASQSIANAIGGLQQQVFASQQLTLNQQYLLNQSVLTQQSANAVNRVETLFALQTMVQLQTTWQALSDTLLAWMQRTTEQIALNSLVPDVLTEMANEGMVLFASDPGRPPRRLNATERYQQLATFAFYYIPAGSHDGSVVRRVSWMFNCDQQWFALDTRPRNSFSSVEEWMGPASCAVVNASTVRSPPLGGVTCRCYSTLVVEQAVNSSTSGALALMLHGTKDAYTVPLRTPPAQLDSDPQPPATVGVWQVLSRQHLFSLADFQAAWLSICLLDVENIVDVQLNLTGSTGGKQRSQGWVLRSLQETVVPDTIVLASAATTDARPYCTTQLDLLTSFVNLQNGGQTVASTIYNGLLDMMRGNAAQLVKVKGQLIGSLPIQAAVDTGRQAFSELGSLFDPENIEFLSVLNVPPPIDPVNPPDSDIFISYRVDTLTLAAVSVDAVPIVHHYDKEIIQNVWTSTSASPSELLDDDLDANNTIVNVRLLNNPFDTQDLLPSTWNMAGYPACLFDPLCPIAPFALNASDNGRILEVIQFAQNNRTRFTHTFDVESDDLETSLQQSQRRNRPTLPMELVDSDGPLDAIYDGVARRRPAVSVTEMEAQTGNRFDPTEATASLSSGLVEVAINPQTGCIQCIGLRAAANGVCRKFDLFCYEIDMKAKTVRLSSLSMNWKLRVTLRLVPLSDSDNILPVPVVPAGCPTTITVQPRDTDTTLLLLTDSSAQAPLLSLTVNVLRAPDDADGCASQTLLVGPGNLTAFQTYAIPLATCSSLALTVSAGPVSCYGWQAPIRPVISIGGIPERVFTHMVAQVDQFGVTLRAIGEQLSNMLRQTRTNLNDLVGNVIRSTSAAQAQSYLDQMRVVRQQFNDGQAQVQAVLLEQQSLFGTLTDLLAHIQNVSNAIHAADQAAITERLTELTLQQQQVAALLVQQQALLPQLNQLADFQLQVTQATLNANFFISTAPPDFSWNDIQLYLDLINNNCPAQWEQQTSYLECVLVWYDPASWFDCISGQWIGLSFFILGLIGAAAFNFILLLAASCCQNSGKFGLLWSYVVLGKVPHKSLSQTDNSSKQPAAAAEAAGVVTSKAASKALRGRHVYAGILAERR